MKYPTHALAKLILIAAIIVVLIGFGPPVFSMVFPVIFGLCNVICQIAYHLRYELFPCLVIVAMICYFVPRKGKLVFLGTMVLLSPGFFIILAIYRFALGGLLDHFFQSIYYFATGWIYTMPRLFIAVLRYSPAWGVGLLALFLLTAAVHELVTRAVLKKGNIWQFRQSLAVAGIVCSFGITAVTMTAMTRELTLLAQPQDDLTERWSMGKRIDAHGRPFEDGTTAESDAEVIP